MSHLIKKRCYAIFILFILTVFSISVSIWAEEKKADNTPFKLTIENIMKGPELIGSPPSNVSWSVDGKKIYFRWKKPDEERTELYYITPKNLTPQKTNLDDILKTPPVRTGSSSRFSRFGGGGFGFGVRYDKKKQRALISQNGDIFFLDLVTKEMTQFTFTDERESNINFTSDENKVCFVSGDDLFTLSLKDGLIHQRTSFTRRKPPERKPPDEIDKWYSEQQKELFGEFNRRRGSGSQMGMFAPSSGRSRRKPFFIKEDQSVFSHSLSPDEKFVYFVLSENLPDAKRTIVPKYVTRSGYTETINAHPKAAESSYDYKAGIMDTSSGKITWIDYGEIEKKVLPSGVIWSPDGKNCLLTASSDDRKDEWLFLLDIKTGKTTVIEHVHDDAWIGYLSLTNVTWMSNSKDIAYISEKNGYAHLYIASIEKKEKKQLTKGRFEVYSVNLSKDGKKWYLTSNEEHPGERHFYSMPRDGGKRKKITSLKGHNQVILSPDESSLAVIHSSSTAPPELYFQPNKPGAKAQRITLSTTKEFLSYSWYKPKIITFKARDGVDVYARIYVPEKWHASKPSVIFIHGAGYLQNAHHGWSSYYKEYMFHNLLMKNGYLVFDIDYRGSAGYGRDCRTAVYRHMGGKDLDDIVDGAKFLAEKYKANPDRIGVYGGSYGGFLTFMAMFTAADNFKAGASLRPVTDWAHYHPGYTVDILNMPHKDPEAYKQSSPIYFVEGLKGALLICHGMVDTNVHFQDTVRLAQRLIELGKENWEVAIYPVEGHSFRNASSWTDEYKRIFKLFEINLK